MTRRCATRARLGVTGMAELERSASRKPRVLLVYHRGETSGGSFNSVLDLLKYRSGGVEFVGLLPGPGNCQREMELSGISTVLRAVENGSRDWNYARSVMLFRYLLWKHEIDLVYYSDFIYWRPSLSLAAKWGRLPIAAHIRTPIESKPLVKELASYQAIIGNSQATLNDGLWDVSPKTNRHVIYNFVDFGRSIRRKISARN